eukprot:PhM_4_TR15534/c0_g1_i1/m.12955
MTRYLVQPQRPENEVTMTMLRESLGMLREELAALDPAAIGHRPSVPRKPNTPREEIFDIAAIRQKHEGLRSKTMGTPGGRCSETIRAAQELHELELAALGADLEARYVDYLVDTERLYRQSHSVLEGLYEAHEPPQHDDVGNEQQQQQNEEGSAVEVTPSRAQYQPPSFDVVKSSLHSAIAELRSELDELDPDGSRQGTKASAPLTRAKSFFNAIASGDEENLTLEERVARRQAAAMGGLYSELDELNRDDELDRRLREDYATFVVQCETMFREHQQAVEFLYSAAASYGLPQKGLVPKPRVLPYVARTPENELTLLEVKSSVAGLHEELRQLEALVPKPPPSEADETTTVNGVRGRRKAQNVEEVKRRQRKLEERVGRRHDAARKIQGLVRIRAVRMVMSHRRGEREMARKVRYLVEAVLRIQNLFRVWKSRRVANELRDRKLNELQELNREAAAMAIQRNVRRRILVDSKEQNP